MKEFIIGLVIGLVIGEIAGVVTVALCSANSLGGDRNE